MRRLWNIGIVSGLIWVAAGLCACKDDNGKKDKGPPVVDGSRDGVTCGTRPATIDDCLTPPNMYSNSLYFCQCTGTCNSGAATAACNGTNGDCRYFYDSCLPATYEACETASGAALDRCNACFFRETGAGSPKYCDKISPDMGTPKEAGRDTGKPREAGTKDGSKPKEGGPKDTGPKDGPGKS